jgi:hypothetical protein
MQPEILSPGQLVKLRQRAWIIDEVITSTNADECTQVSLSCIDDDNQGAQIAVYWEKELDAEVLTAHDFSSVQSRGFDDPDVFAAYINTLRWNCVTATNPNLFQAPFRAGIKIEPYQLEPLRRALTMPRVNLFIADDVGLGKTIEAGLIVRELMLRKKASFIVVSAPPSMIAQWQSELDSRFGLEFEIFDREYVQRIREQRGHATNPWTTHSRFLISHKLLIDASYTEPLAAMLGDFESRAVLVLDEAHHAAPSTGSKYAIDSQMTRAVRDLAPRFEHRIFLSATPHNGHSNSFSALLEILDKNKFTRGEKVDPKRVRDVVIRRIKSDVRAVTGGFPERVIKRIDLGDLSPDTAELVLPKLLMNYAELRDKRLATAPPSIQNASNLVISGLQQRLLSSVKAFSRTLAGHVRGVEEKSGAIKRQSSEYNRLVSSVSSDDDESESNEEEIAINERRQFESASASPTMPSPEEIALLRQMTAIANKHAALPDAKINYLINWIREHMCPQLPLKQSNDVTSAHWNEKRLIIFTEWEDTKSYIVAQIEQLILKTHLGEQRIATFHGTTSKDKREEIKRAFNAPPDQHPLRILIATDAAREGLNLQSHCHNLFHFDIPWNPSRLEQRNGRIDRKLQPAPQVYCHYFNYVQRAEDPLVQKIVEKSERIRAELGSVPQVIIQDFMKLVKQGNRATSLNVFMDSAIDIAIEKTRAADTKAELDAASVRQDELREQIKDLTKLKNQSAEHIRLGNEDFLRAINASLAVQRFPGITPITHHSGAAAFEFPRLDLAQGASSRWSVALDALRRPRNQNESVATWRREAPIRPLLFDDPGILDDSAVHMHLGHRLAQRLLGRFIAQGFTADDIARCCYLQADDNIPRVVLLGRISIFGPGASRLHEEIISISSRWAPLRERKQPLQPYASDADRKTLAMLDELLGAQVKSKPIEPITHALSSHAATDCTELMPQLKDRANEAINEAVRALKIRGDREMAAMASFLSERRQRIQELQRTSQHNAGGFILDLADPMERRQLERDMEHWKNRLAEIERDIETEPQKVADSYTVRATNLEPIGLIYLWPKGKKI